MERVFFRQLLQLPDSKPDISPSDLSRLRTLSDGEVLILRRKIRDAKITWEKEDPDNAGETPFAQFCALWDGASDGNIPHVWDVASDDEIPPREKCWIGPNGLLSVKARQAARLILARSKEKEKRDLLDNLRQNRSPADTDADIAGAVAKIPFPPIGIDLDKQKAIAASGTDPTEFAKKLFREARTDQFNYDLIDLLDAWDTEHRGMPLVLPTWPLSSKNDWKGLFPVAAPPYVPQALAKNFLAKRLEQALQERAEDATAGVDCTKPKPCATPEGLLLPVEARISGASRLAFEFSKKELALTTDNLTNWQDFRLKVVRQAHRLYKTPKSSELENDVAAILTDQGITRSPGPELWDSVRRFGEIRDAIKVPTRFETALEVPSRLILSPAQDAKWRTSRELPANLAFWKAPVGSPNLVWQARLIEALPTPSLRAIWSPDYQPKVFDFNENRADNPPLGPWAPWDLIRTRNRQTGKWTDNDKSQWTRFRAALDSADRHELVVLSSVPGLPVVGIPPKDKNSDKKDTSQVGPPQGYSLQDIAKVQVSPLALLWQIFSGTGFPNQFFNNSWVVGFWRADHGRHNAELGRRASRMAQAVLGSPGP